QDEIDAGQVLFGCKGNAAVDDKPLAPPLVAEPIDRKIHPDLADAAERRENKLALRHQSTRPVAGERAVRSPTGNTSPAMIVCRLPSARRSSSRPFSSSPTQRPTNSRLGSRTRIWLPIPVARSSQSARIAAKPAPRRHCASRRSIVPERAQNRSSAVTSAPAARRSVAG